MGFFYRFYSKVESGLERDDKVSTKNFLLCVLVGQLELFLDYPEKLTEEHKEEIESININKAHLV